MATLVADMVRTMSAELPKRTYDSMTRRLLGSALEDMTDLVDSKVQEKVDRIRTALQTLLSISRTRVKTIPFQLVDGDTLRIYTDSSLLLSALDLITWQKGDQGDSEEGRTGEGYGGTGPELWFESVRRLDMAIIVAGAARTRGEWVHRLISAVQDHLPGLGDARVRKRRRLSIPRHALSTPSTLSPFAASPIPERSPPSPSDYAAEASKPFIIRNYISDDGAHPRWPAMQRWRDATYLLDAVGRGRVVPVEIGSSYDSEEWGQQIIAFETFLQSAGWDIPHEQCSDIESRPLYLAQTALFAQFPALEKDFSTPEYVFSEPRSTLPSYSAPDEPLINVWIGPGRNVTSPAHTVRPFHGLLTPGPVFQLLCPSPWL